MTVHREFVEGSQICLACSATDPQQIPSGLSLDRSKGESQGETLVGDKEWLGPGHLTAGCSAMQPQESESR